MIKEKFEAERLVIPAAKVKRFWTLYDEKKYRKTYITVYELWNFIFTTFPKQRDIYKSFDLYTGSVIWPQLIVNDYRFVPTRWESLMFKYFKKKSKDWQWLEEDDEFKDKIYLGEDNEA